MATKETIWQNWTNESAEAVHSVGYDELLEGVIDLWNKLITTVQEYEDAITGGRQRFHDEEEADGN